MKNQIFDNPVKVTDKEGRKYFCAPDSKLCGKADCLSGSNRDVPIRIDELSRRERSTCWDVSEMVGDDSW